MAEGRVADVVGQAGGGHDVAAVLVEVGQLPGQNTVIFEQVAGGKAAQGAAHHGGFERVGEAGVHKIRFGQGHRLGFALESAECGTEHHPVVVLHEGPTYGGGGSER